jgi:hypothetical protein
MFCCVLAVVISLSFILPTVAQASIFSKASAYTSSVSASVFSSIAQLFGFGKNADAETAPLPAVKIVSKKSITGTTILTVATTTISNPESISKQLRVQGSPQVLAAFTPALTLANQKYISEDQFVFSLFLLEKRLENAIASSGGGGHTVPPNIYLSPAITSPASTWGSISGTLASQTDLQAALDAKFSLADWYATTTGSVSSQWTTSSSNIYFTGGNVGIGTTSPRSLLHITQGASGKLPFAGTGLTLESNSSQYLSFLNAIGENGIFFSANTNIDGGIIYNNTARGMQFRTGGNTIQMTITSTGNVGIGTTSATSKLQVEGASTPLITAYTSGLTGVLPSLRGSEGLVTFRANSGNSSTESSIAIIGANAGSSRLTFGDTADGDIGGINYDHANDRMEFITNTGTQVAINSGGNLGIGTTSPTSKLHIAGSNQVAMLGDAGVGFSSFVNFNSRGFVGYDTNANSGTGALAIQGAAARGIMFNVNNSNFGQGTAMVITSGGNVGIGTTSPSGKLHVTSGSAGAYTLADSLKSIVLEGNGAGSASAGMTFATDDAGSGGLRWNSPSSSTFGYAFLTSGGYTAGDLTIATNKVGGYISLKSGANTEAVRIASGGNVGIGITSPTSKLSIIGTGGATTTIGTDSTAVTTGDTIGTLDFRAPLEGSGGTAITTGAYMKALAVGGFTSGTGAPSDLTFGTYQSSVGLSERLRITSTGNVAIGTTTPNHKFEVYNGNITADIGDLYAIGATGGCGGRCQFVLSATDGTGPRLKLGTTATPNLFFELGAYSNQNNFDSKTRDLQLFGTGHTGIMIKATTGNVGIGTTTPRASLDILKSYSAGTDALRINAGDAASDYWMGIQPFAVGSGNVGYKFRTNNGATARDTLVLTGGGNVGIGTTTPGYRLSIYNTASASSFTGLHLVNDSTTSGSSVAARLGVYNGNNGLIIEQSSNSTGPSWASGSYDAFIRTGQSGSKLHFGSNNASNPEVTLSAGNLGIGTTSPQGKLEVYTSGSDGGFRVRYNGEGTSEWFSVGNGAAGLVKFNAAGGQTQVGGSGDLGARMNIGALTTSFVPLAISGVSGQTADLFRVNTNGTGGNQFIIKASGNVGIGTTTPEFPLDVYSSVSSNQTYGYLNSGGTVGSTSGTNLYSIRAQQRILAPEFNAVSDARLKDVQFSIDQKLALSLIAKLQPVSFTWKSNPTGQPILGFLAQDVEGIIPNAVSKLETANFADQRQLDYNQLITMSIGAIKELDARTALLQSAIGSSTDLFATSSIQMELAKQNTSLLSEFAAFFTGTGNWMQARVSAATGFFKNIFAKEITTDKLCVGQTCVTEDQLKTLLNNNGAAAATQPQAQNPAPITPPPPTEPADPEERDEEPVVPEDTVEDEPSIVEEQDIVEPEVVVEEQPKPEPQPETTVIPPSEPITTTPPTEQLAI